MNIWEYFNELKVDAIKPNEFEIMKDLFGEDVLNDFFENILKYNDPDNNEKVNKIIDNYIFDIEQDMGISDADNYLDDYHSGYINSIKSIKVLTKEEDMKYGKLLLENRDVFNISANDMNNIFMDKKTTKIGKKMLDLEKIFVSINNEKDKDEILKLFNDYYSIEVWNENNIDKVMKYYIKEYMSLSSKVGVPDSKQLNDYFKNKIYDVFVNFDINKKVDNIDKLKINLKKYLTYMYARNVFIVHNLKLVCSLAYLNRTPNTNIMDVIEDGNLGLFRAVDRYDYRRGCKFSTFAYLTVKHSIIRERDNNSKLIRMPVHCNEAWRKISMFRSAYTKNFGIEPSAELIAFETNISLKFVKSLLYYEENYFVVSSLNSIIGDDENVELLNCLSSRELPTDEQAMRNVVKSIILETVNGLEDRDKDIIIKRFGFDGKGGKTLHEIGKEYNLSRQRIKQLESGILNRLAQNNEISKLKGFYKY